MARRRPPLGEIGVARAGLPGARLYAQALWPIPPNDPVLLQAGGWRGYEELLRDDQVAATFTQRRLAVVRRPVVVEPGGERRVDQRAADLVRETLDRIEFDRITDQMLYARLYGWAVAEVIWATASGGYIIDAIRVRDRQHFAFTADGQLLIKTERNPLGEVVPPMKFWAVTVGASHHDEPYGRGLGHQLYWPVYFKRNGAKFWAIFLEKFGAPTVLGRFQPGTSKQERDLLLDALEAVQTDAAVIVPEGVPVELLEASRAGSPTYAQWLQYWDDAIAKIIVGQTMTTEDGSSLAQAKVHYDVRADIVASDADLVCESANRTWVRWLIDVTMPGAAYPRIYREMEEPEDLLARAQRDQILHGLGIRLTPDAVARVYGDDYEMVEPKPAPDDGGEAPPELPSDDEIEPVEAREGAQAIVAAEPPRDDHPVRHLEERLVTETTPVLQDWLGRIRQLAEEARSLPELRERVLAAYRDLPADDLVEVMRLAYTVSHALGRWDAHHGSRHRRERDRASQRG